jgi:outer membrane protein assembly factor BamB
VVAAIVAHQDTIYAPVASFSPRGAAYRTTSLFRVIASRRQIDSLSTDPSDSSSLSRWLLATSELLVSATNYSDPSWLAFDSRTGARRWKISAKGGSLGPSSQIAVHGDTVFAGGNDGLGYVFLISTGRLLRTFPIPSGLVSGVASCGDELLINVIGELTAFTHDGMSRGLVSGLATGADSFMGGFAVGAGVAVIGVGDGKWAAFECS